MNYRVLKAAFIASAVLALGTVALFTSGIPAPSAFADDLDHTTTFAYSTEGSDNTVLATFSSSDTSDARATITIYFTPNGGSEQEFGGARAKRSDVQGLWLEDEEAYAFTTATSFRARFTTYDATGSVRWYYDRYLYP